MIKFARRNFLWPLLKTGKNVHAPLLTRCDHSLNMAENSTAHVQTTPKLLVAPPSAWPNRFKVKVDLSTPVVL